MATGPEMMISALLKMCGINTPDLQKQVATAVQAVLSFDRRLKCIEDHLMPPTQEQTQNDDQKAIAGNGSGHAAGGQ